MINKDKASESDCIEAFSHDNDSFNFALKTEDLSLTDRKPANCIAKFLKKVGE